MKSALKCPTLAEGFRVAARRSRAATADPSKQVYRANLTDSIILHLFAICFAPYKIWTARHIVETGINALKDLEEG